MIISGQFVRVALAVITVLPTLISALNDTEKNIFSREYASTVTKKNIIHFFGGSSTHLEAIFLDATNGLDANSPTWNWGDKPPGSDFKAFTRGVAFAGNNDDIFLQGGEGSTAFMENLVVFNNNKWRKAPAIGDVPAATALMTANLNPSDNSVYYYGGRLIKNHQLDVTAASLNTFYKFDVNNGIWSTLNPATNGIERPGRTAHTSNLVNDQVFIMGGVSDFKNDSKVGPSADFASVLVYDISKNTAVSITTLGDIPPARNSYSTALGLNGHSIVMYGGILVGGKDEGKAAPTDVYVLDTCSLTWSKQSTKGSAPGSLNSHNAININNYMVLALGKTNDKDYNFNIAILDMAQWKWVSTFTETKNTIQPGSCKFELPSIDGTITSSTDYSPMNYDDSVMTNPLTPVEKKVDSKGFGIGFGILAVVLIAVGAYFYVKRVRNKKSRTLNPRWMRSAPANTNSGYSNDRDYPLFVYNKELDTDNINNPNVPRSQTAFATNGVRTYTASDHEQWEQELNGDAANSNGVTSSRNSDIWNRMRGLNDASVISDEEVQRNRTNNGRLVDL
ncbi:hypothetical protein EDC94DRAFT_615525 [Helicostylum pulchrum]|nr:hypothetical protein EDC94DRAFT_615525 [Helicostylum pulchrum]